MLVHSPASKAVAKRLLSRCAQSHPRSRAPTATAPAHYCSPLCSHAQHSAFSSLAATRSSCPFARRSTATASAQSTSSSSSSSFFSSTFAGISAIVVATGAAIIALTSDEAEAAAATETTTTTTTTVIPPGPPPLILPTITPGPLPTSSRPAAASSPYLSSPPRAPLPNPGKFDHTHRESSNLTNSQAFSGGRLQLGLPLFTADAITGLEPDKQVVFIPVVQAGEGGGHGMLNVRTSLGHRHLMEAMVDTQWNVVGEYKYMHAPWVIKPTFRSITQQGDDMSLEVDYKGREFVAQALLGSNAQEYVFSHLRSVHRNLALGVQLHALLGQVAFLNFTGRYNNGQGDVLSVSRKNAMYMLSYHRTVLDQPATPASPPSNVSLATELRVHEQSKQSEWAVGLQYARPLFKYALCVSSDWRVGVLLEQNVGGAVQMSVGGEMKYDGSGESKFGVGISIG